MTGLSRTLRMRNRMGLHMLPAAEMVRIAYAHNSEIIVLKHGHRASAKSIFSLMRLGVRCGDRIEVSASGPDAENALDAMCQYLESYRDSATPSGRGNPPDMDSYAA